MNLPIKTTMKTNLSTAIRVPIVFKDWLENHRQALIKSGIPRRIASDPFVINLMYNKILKNIQPNNNILSTQFNKGKKKFKNVWEMEVKFKPFRLISKEEEKNNDSNK